MIRRLCLFLLLLGLALPATAAPMHCAPGTGMAMAGVEHGGKHQGTGDVPMKQVAQHDCIGCIAPYATVAPPPARAFLTALRDKPLDDLLLARLTTGPDTPPPRA